MNPTDISKAVNLIVISSADILDRLSDGYGQFTNALSQIQLINNLLHATEVHYKRAE